MPPSQDWNGKNRVYGSPTWAQIGCAGSGRPRGREGSGCDHGVGAEDGGEVVGGRGVRAGRGEQGLGRPRGRAGLGPRAAESRIGEVLCGHFKKCVTINILCSELVTRLLVTNQRLSACQAPFAIIHMISKFSIICT